MASGVLAVMWIVAVVMVVAMGTSLGVTVGIASPRRGYAQDPTVVAAVAALAIHRCCRALRRDLLCFTMAQVMPQEREK